MGVEGIDPQQTDGQRQLGQHRGSSDPILMVMGPQSFQERVFPEFKTKQGPEQEQEFSVQNKRQS